MTNRTPTGTNLALSRRSLLNLTAGSAAILAAPWAVGAKSIGAQGDATATGGELLIPFQAWELVYPMSGHRVARVVFDRLVDLDVEGNLHPNLAEEWEVSPDATTFTFRLRQGVTWHDGEAFDTDDVVFSVKWLLAKENILTVSRVALWGQIEGATAFVEGTAQEITGLEVVDDQTIRVTLVGPNAGWLTTAVSQTDIVPEHVYRDIPFERIQEPYAAAWYEPDYQIGTGPFKWVEAEYEGFVRLARHDVYWGGAPKLDSLLFKNVGELDAQFAALQTGELDFLGVTGEYYLQAQGMPEVNVVTYTRPYVRYLSINLNRPHFADFRIRQAMSHAVHRQVLCDSVLSGLAEPWYSFMEHEVWLNQNLPTYPYDPPKAKELIAAAVQDGAWDPDTEIELAFYYPSSQDRNFMAGLQTFFTDVGIKTNLAFYESAAGTTKQEEGDFDLMYGGWGAPPEPDAYSSAFQCDVATSQFFYGALPDTCTPIAELFKQGVQLSGFDERKAIYDEAQRLFGESLPSIPLFRFKQAMAINNRVSGFDLGAQTMFSSFVFNHHGANLWSVSS